MHSGEGTYASLDDVRRGLPGAVYVRSNRLGLGLFVRDCLGLGLGSIGLFWVDGVALLPLWLLAGLSISGLFILGHDAAHGSLVPHPRINAAVARVCLGFGLHGFRAWSLGHNRIHHAHTTRQSLDYVWHPLTPAQYRALSPAARWLHRIEWSAIGAGLYYLRQIWWRKQVLFSLERRGLRRELAALAIAATIYGSALAGLGWLRYGHAWGALWMWFKVFVVPLLMFCQTIGWVVYVQHIAPEIPWRAGRSWSAFASQVHGTTSLRVPSVLNWFLHDILLHAPHHIDPRIPCYHLSRAALALGELVPVTIRDFHLREYLRSTRHCKLFDFERQIWAPYEGA